jgi:hypothetical protein
MTQPNPAESSRSAGFFVVLMGSRKEDKRVDSSVFASFLGPLRVARLLA